MRGRTERIVRGGGLSGLWTHFVVNECSSLPVMALHPRGSNFGEQRSGSRNLYDFESGLVPSDCLNYCLTV